MPQWVNLLAEENRVIDEDLWAELVELTGGTASIIVECVRRAVPGG